MKSGFPVRRRSEITRMKNIIALPVAPDVLTRIDRYEYELARASIAFANVFIVQ